MVRVTVLNSASYCGIPFLFVDCASAVKFMDVALMTSEKEIEIKVEKVKEEKEEGEADA